MNCTYSDPKILDTDGSLIDPTDDSKPFQFSTSECTEEESTETATVSGELDVNVLTFDDLTNFLQVSYSFYLLAVFFFGFYIYTRFFQRNA